MSKTLICYFSCTGVTEKKAKQLADVLNGDLARIEPAVKYTSEDLDWMDKNSRTTVESKDHSLRPEMLPLSMPVEDYDTILVGYPIWWYTCPDIIFTFFEENDLKGKKILLFSTSGGSSPAKSEAELKKNYPDLDIRGSLNANGQITRNQLEALLK